LSVFRVVIPARFGSTRLPGKVLLEIDGKSVLEWVHRRARASRASEVIIATDDDRVANVARAFKADVAMTSAAHPSGTDRIAEVARVRGWNDDDVVVNVQGDEPLMPAALVDQVADLLAAGGADIGTLSSPLQDPADLADPNVVKVVADAQGRALYFSRAPIPWNRDAPGAPREARRHVGIYSYRVAALKRLASLPASPLEQLEKLEQLRALENGLLIHVADARERPGQDVNTAEDLARVTRELQRS
jgi:3-deoxy-manno-octulosonate cytidylyltransferase (CMP-KDO synthetase)